MIPWYHPQITIQFQHHVCMLDTIIISLKNPMKSHFWHHFWCFNPRQIHPYLDLLKEPSPGSKFLGKSAKSPLKKIQGYLPKNIPVPSSMPGCCPAFAADSLLYLPKTSRISSVVQFLGPVPKKGSSWTVGFFGWWNHAPQHDSTIMIFIFSWFCFFKLSLI